MQRRLHDPRRYQRRGAVLALVAVSLLVLLGFVAFAVDIGFMYNLRAEMQRTADSAALAGASAMQKKDGGGAVLARAQKMAMDNEVNRIGVQPSEVDVTIGNWEGLTGTFYEVPFNTNPRPNAVKVVGDRDRIPLFFGPVLGAHSTRANKLAVALSGGGICAGLWGLEGITGDGDILTDSYRASEGDYGIGDVYANGDLCSCQNINLYGSVEIHGDTIYGTGYELYIEGQSHDIWGNAGEQACGAYVPPFDMNNARIFNDNASIGLTTRGHSPFPDGPWNLYVTGNDSLALTRGSATYYFDTAIIDGQATLTIADQTTIYIAGDATLTGGGVVNLTQDPRDLIIYCTGTTVTITGTSAFYGAVIAPNATIVLPGDLEFYGTMLGRTLDIDGNASIHVEESLVETLFGVSVVKPMLVQ